MATLKGTVPATFAPRATPQGQEAAVQRHDDLKIVPCAVPKDWPKLKAHPLAAIAEFKAGIDLQGMADHMRRHGYDASEPIILFQNLILDGRHRFAAAILAGVIPTFALFCGQAASAYVHKKAFRQHLDTSQRAMIAADILKVYRTEKVDVEQICSTPTSEVDDEPTQEKLAGSMNVSRRTVVDAVKVAEQGTEELQQAVRSGDIPVSAAAKVADKPAAQQKKAVKEASKPRAKRKAAATPRLTRPQRYSLASVESACLDVENAIKDLANEFGVSEKENGCADLLRQYRQLHGEVEKWHKYHIQRLGVDDKEPGPAKPKGRQKKTEPPVVFPEALNTERFKAAWETWVTHRKEIKHALKPTTIAAQLKKLAGWGEEKAIKAIETSIENGWQGIFEPTEGTGKNGRMGSNRLGRLEGKPGEFDEYDKGTPGLKERLSAKAGSNNPA